MTGGENDFSRIQFLNFTSKMCRRVPTSPSSAVTKSGTGTWDLGRGDLGTWGRGDVGTWGLRDSGTWGRGDVGTWRLGDSGTCELGDVGTRRHIFEV